MQPENLKFGGGAEGTVLHPIALVALLVGILLIMFVRRKYLIFPFLLIAFLLPLGQQIVFGGFHLLLLRIVILAGLVRMIFSTPPPGGRLAGGFNTLDRVFVLWASFHVVAFLFLFSFQFGAFTNQVGFVWDVFGGFFLLRYLIQDDEDIDRTVRVFAFITMIIAVGMLNEHFRMQNVFGMLGGVQAVPELRDGVVRAQGPFAHPLLAGTFGATLLPLFFLLLVKGQAKIVGVIGMVSSTIMSLMAASSTPFIASAAGIFALCLWPIRKQMRIVRWGIVLALIGLNIVMKAPVWFLISHVSIMGSSSSDHRAQLVDMFIRHFGDWWLIGTNSNASWGWDMWDTSNQFVAEGENGGLAAFVCFIAMISICFSWIGKARKAAQGDRKMEWRYWIFGAALFSNVVAFWGISYFDQTRDMWFALLVMIAVTTAPLVLAKKAEAGNRVGGGWGFTRLTPVSSPMPISTGKSLGHGLDKQFKTRGQ